MIAPAGTSPALQMLGRIAMAETGKTPAGIKRSRFVGNIVLRIAAYDPSETKEQCYPGVASGVVSGGPLDGRRIEIAIRPTAINSRVPKISDFADPASMSHTEPGGFIAFENVRENNGDFLANWANRFAGPKDTLRVGMPIRIAPSLNRKRRGAGGRSDWRHFAQRADSASPRNRNGAFQKRYAGVRRRRIRKQKRRISCNGFRRRTHRRTALNDGH